MTSDSATSPSNGYARILLTGASGFVGGYLAPLLANAFPDAQRWATTRPGVSEDVEGWQSVVVDSGNPMAIDACVRDVAPDLIVHLAAQASVAAGFAAAEQTWRTNFGLTFELATACARHTPDATFFFVSSSEVYGHSFKDGTVDETSPLRPANTYARSKAAAEAALADVLAPGNHAIIVRPFNHTGPGQDRRFVIPSFLAQIANLEQQESAGQIEVGNIDVKRDFLDVRDVCEGYVALLKLPKNPGSIDIYNISSGSAFKLRDLIEVMRGLSMREFSVETSPRLWRSVDVPQAMGNNSRMVQATGWKPERDIGETLRDTLAYWRKQSPI